MKATPTLIPLDFAYAGDRYSSLEIQPVRLVDEDAFEVISDLENIDEADVNIWGVYAARAGIAKHVADCSTREHALALAELIKDATKPGFALPITILSENEAGEIGSEDHDAMTRAEVITRCRELSAQGWEPQEIQGGDSMASLDIRWWVETPEHPEATPEQIDRASELYGSDEITIDAGARVSEVDDIGVWVQAWVWVPNDED